MPSFPNRLGKPVALVVFLENVGHIHGVPLPQWAMDVIDFLLEEYAKLLLRLFGAYRQYDTIITLEDEEATGPRLAETLLHYSRSHRLDLLLLVHGHEGCLVGYRGKERVGAETFAHLSAAYRQDQSALDLRMVYGLNCYGVSLAPTWLSLGAKVVNGAAGVNWLPEPSLSIFLWKWLHGARYSEAVRQSHRVARRWGSRIWPPSAAGVEHPRIAGSRQAIFGAQDITIHSP